MITTESNEMTLAAVRNRTSPQGIGEIYLFARGVSVLSEYSNSN